MLILLFNFKDVIEELYNATNAKTKAWQPLVCKKLRDIVKENSDVSFKN